MSDDVISRPVRASSHGRANRVAARAQLLSPKVLSNGLFLIPCLIGLIHGLALLAALAFAVACASSAYHLSGEARFRLLDVVAACCLISANGMLLMGSELRQPYTLLAVAALAIALYFFFVRARDNWEWHLASAIITMFCTLAYVEAGAAGTGVRLEFDIGRSLLSAR